MSRAAVVLSSAVLVFREGLEAILVLAAVTAGLARSGKGYARGVAVGSGLALAATVATWFVVVAIISEVNASELHIQAATGLLAILVLLVVMNWFFHKIYWTGWIAHHDRRRRRLLEEARTPPAPAPSAAWPCSDSPRSTGRDSRSCCSSRTCGCGREPAS